MNWEDFNREQDRRTAQGAIVPVPPRGAAAELRARGVLNLLNHINSRSRVRLPNDMIYDIGRFIGFLPDRMHSPLMVGDGRTVNTALYWNRPFLPAFNASQYPYFPSWNEGVAERRAARAREAARAAARAAAAAARAAERAAAERAAQFVRTARNAAAVGRFRRVRGHMGSAEFRGNM